MLRTIGMVLYVAGYMICALPGLLHAKLLEKNPEKARCLLPKKNCAVCPKMPAADRVELEIRGLDRFPRKQPSPSIIIKAIWISLC